MICIKLIYSMLVALSLLQDIGSDRLKRLATPNFDQETYDTIAKYVVSIRSRTPQKYFGDNHFCGGTIISSLFVLTAAHCVMDNRKIVHRSRMLLVVAGTPNRLKHVLGRTVNVPVTQLIVHTNFTLYNSNNIALLKLSKHLPKDNKYIGIIKMPTQEPSFGKMYRVMGWGRVYDGGPLASRILYIDVELLEHSFCKSLIRSYSSQCMLCAGNFNKSDDEDPCPGDSGDPLLDGVTLYGIATYGLGCGNFRWPSVYTNVFQHVEWINEMIAINASPKRHLPILHPLIQAITKFLFRCV